MLEHCRHVVRIPTRFALNLAVAGALVLYDRMLQHGRFADRPVGSGGRPGGLAPPRPRPPAVPQDHSGVASRGREEAMSAPRLFRVRAGPISARMNTRFA